GELRSISNHLVHGQRDLVTKRSLEGVHEIEVRKVLFKLSHGDFEAPLVDRDLLGLNGRASRRKPVSFAHSRSQREGEDARDSHALTFLLPIARLCTSELHELGIRNSLTPNVRAKRVVLVGARRGVKLPRHLEIPS